VDEEEDLEAFEGTLVGVEGEFFHVDGVQEFLASLVLGEGELEVARNKVEVSDFLDEGLLLSFAFQAD